MKLLLILFILPVVLAGDFYKMWSDLEENLKEKVEKMPSDFKDNDWKPRKKGSKDEQYERWGDDDWKPRNQGWRDEQYEKWGDEEEVDDEKSIIMNKFNEFQQFIRRKEMKEKEKQEAKAVLHTEIKKVQLKKLLNDKLEDLTKSYEQKRVQFIFQTVWHFLGLCSGEASPKDLLERYDVAYYGDGNAPLVNSTNMSSNGTPLADVGTFDDERSVRWFVDMAPEDKLQYLLYAFVQGMCGAAQNLVGQVEQFESNIDRCRRYRTGCDLFP